MGLPKASNVCRFVGVKVLADSHVANDKLKTSLSHLISNSAMLRKKLQATYQYVRD